MKKNFKFSVLLLVVSCFMLSSCAVVDTVKDFFGKNDVVEQDIIIPPPTDPSIPDDTGGFENPDGTGGFENPENPDDVGDLGNIENPDIPTPEFPSSFMKEIQPSYAAYDIAGGNARVQIPDDWWSAAKDGFDFAHTQDLLSRYPEEGEIYSAAMSDAFTKAEHVWVATAHSSIQDPVILNFINETNGATFFQDPSAYKNELMRKFDIDFGVGEYQLAGDPSISNFGGNNFMICQYQSRTNGVVSMHYRASTVNGNDMYTFVIDFNNKDLIQTLSNDFTKILEFYEPAVMQ